MESGHCVLPILSVIVYLCKKGIKIQGCEVREHVLVKTTLKKHNSLMRWYFNKTLKETSWAFVYLGVQGLPWDGNKCEDVW